MDRLLPLLLSVTAQDFGAVARRAKRNTILYGCVGLFLITAYIAGVIGLALWASWSFGPIGAAFVVAIAALTAALVVIAVIMIWDRIERNRRPPPPSNAMLMAATAATAVPAILKSRALMTAIAVGFIGYSVLAWVKKPAQDDGEA